MPTASSRATWKGAISFGLVHIPIELRSATVEVRPAFRMIDPNSASQVGYRQVSKATGKEVAQGDIVKGIEVDEGQYVTMTRDEIRAALPKITQTIAIEAFVEGAAIPPAYYAKPYHVIPSGRGGQKAYELLRRVLEETGKVGIAKVVISTRQHLAALMPVERGMVLNLLRWHEEVRSMEGLQLPEDSVQVNAKELKMAEALVEDLTAEWQPDLFHDEFKEQLAALIEAKTKAGKTIAVSTPAGAAESSTSANVVDLTALLRQSLERGAKPRAKAAAANDNKVTPLRRAAAAKAPAKASASVKPAGRRSRG